MVNYKKIGLKAGLEVHVQLDTKHKLFCNCSTEMKEKYPILTIVRKQHPVASELGEVDIAAQYEFLRDRVFNYQVFPKEVCLICSDEEPPMTVNQEALQIALKIALLLNCEIPSEIHVMRKTVTDGSNTTSFQRTMVVGLNGYLKYKGKKILIKQVSLEEDAAAIVEEENGKVTYRLNRLGIPLIEISTGVLSGYTPEEIENIAYNIGMICRSTNKTKKAIGSIRQDINVSISKGARVEIKGVQELSLISKIVESEVRRQISLNQIRNELRKRGVKRIAKPIEVTKYLEDTKNNLLRVLIAKGGSVFALVLPKFSGLLRKELSQGKTLGRELADIASAFGVKGIFHSDEDVGKYNLVEDFKKLRGFLGVKEEDAIILVGELKDKGKVANQLLIKCSKLLEKMEEETRAAIEDGNTRYTRPLPGAARLYVETDLPPIPITKDFLENLKKSLPEPWSKKLVRFKRMGLSEQLAKQILTSEYLELFEKIMETRKVIAPIVANTFTSTLKDLAKREKVKVEYLNENHFLDLFENLEKKKIVKEAIPEILKYLANKPGENVSTAIKELGLQPISMKELKEIVKEVVSQPGLSYEKAVGIVMSKVRGRIDAQTVMRVVKRMI